MSPKPVVYRLCRARAGKGRYILVLTEDLTRGVSVPSEVPASQTATPHTCFTAGSRGERWRHNEVTNGNKRRLI